MRIAFAFAALLFSAPGMGQVMLGEAKAIDGDTIAFGDDMIRIAGIDAPEAPQTCLRSGEEWACGQAATDFLAELLARGRLRCSQLEIDDFGRQVSSCSVAGLDIAQEVLAAGWAVSTSSGNGIHVELEVNARAMQVGLWSGEFVHPRDYRAANPEYIEPQPRRSRARRSQGLFEARPLRRTGPVYFRNCDAARAAGAAPIRRGDPGYRPDLDADNDGIACEPYRRRR